MDIGSRVQIPAYTDAWMRGDRYGTIVRLRDRVSADITLDKSGRTVRCNLDDCTLID